MTAWGVTFPLTRKLGLIMSDPMPVIESGAKVEITRAGRLDHVQAGTVKLQRFFNDLTLSSAGYWIYHHPDDADVVPADLPDPRPVTMSMSGAEYEFTGEPTFGSGGRPVVGAAGAQEPSDRPRDDSGDRSDET